MSSWLRDVLSKGRIWESLDKRTLETQGQRESEMEKLMVQQKEMVKLVRGLSEQVEALHREGTALRAFITKRAPLAQAD